MPEASCCTECFRDPYIRERINETGVDGDCLRCGCNKVKVVSPGELTELFDPIVDQFMISAVGQDRLPSDELFDTTPLLDCIEQEFGTFFSDRLDLADNCRTLFEEIVNYDRLQGDPKDMEWLDLNDAWVPKSDEFTYRSPEDLWTIFAHHLQYERRFIPDEYDHEIIPPQDWLPEFLVGLTRPINGSSNWFRCRDVVVQTGKVVEPLPLCKMGAPPRELAIAGRANPHGIRFLYLSSDEVTSVAEKRAAKGQLVSVAKFIMKADARVIDLTRVPYLDSPFGKSEGMLPYLVERVGIIKHLAEELATPVNPNASDIEYVPTQFLVEVIRSQGFDGVVFNSAMGEGENLVLFNVENASPSSVSVFRVTNSGYSIQQGN